MLTVHHLGKSQSERVVWLCEELGLVRYARDPVTALAPFELKVLHPMGSASLITDGGPVLAESRAIVEYILAKYGDRRLVITPERRSSPNTFTGSTSPTGRSNSPCHATSICAN
jgi:glutathione S-transferase